jgi:hypothetical protein
MGMAFGAEHRPGRLIAKVAIGLSLTAAVVAVAYFRNRKRDN